MVFEINLGFKWLHSSCGVPMEVLDHVLQFVCSGILMCLKCEEKLPNVVRLCSELCPLNITWTKTCRSECTFM